MHYVFYDTETTGTSTQFDQILEFAAVLTDNSLRELDRFSIRCRLLPHIIPSPRALRVTGVRPSRLGDASLPSHYEMMSRINDKLRDWSPALFLGYNSIPFDEELLRQAFFQTLLPCYLTNTDGNTRADILQLAHAVTMYAPDVLRIPTGPTGRPVYKLAPLAAHNGYSDHAAHEALGDVLATLHLARLMRDQAPDIWDAMTQTSSRQLSTTYLDRHPMVSFSEAIYNKHSSWLVTRCGEHPTRRGQFAVFDLAFDPELYVTRSVDDLVRVLNSKKKETRAIRSLAANKQPILMPEDMAPPGTAALELDRAERQRRVEIIRAHPDFRTRVGQALAERFETEAPSAYVEQRIYDDFPNDRDTALLARFHQVPWTQRIAIATQFEDRRLTELARRLIYFEHPELLSTAAIDDLDNWLADRIHGEGDNHPWTTVPKAMQDTDALLQDADGDDAGLLTEVKQFLLDIADRITTAVDR